MRILLINGYIHNSFKPFMGLSEDIFATVLD